MMCTYLKYCMYIYIYLCICDIYISIYIYINVLEGFLMDSPSPSMQTFYYVSCLGLLKNGKVPLLCCSMRGAPKFPQVSTSWDTPKCGGSSVHFDAISWEVPLLGKFSIFYTV